jgi:hypothetical protein
VTPSYLSRLVLLLSASFFLVQLAVGALVAWIAPAAVHRAGSMNPRRAARFLLVLRLLPVAFSVIVVAAWCLPSYVRFEPRIASEEVGFACLGAAILGGLLCGAAIYRASFALIRSSQYVRSCGGFESSVKGERVWVVRQGAGFALAGILRPRLLVSESALARLSSDQLAAALRHENAHKASRDNLKRLLLLLAPPILPRLRLLDQAWAKCAEWAADDRAAEGDVRQSAALAEALVRVARLQSGIAMPRLVTSLVEAGEDLSARVDRLLEAAPVYQSSLHGGAMAVSGMVLLIVSIAINSGSLRVVHHILERLLD